MARALIIESDAALATSLTQLLSAKGVSAQVTADGTEGVNLARSFKPDVIILCVELSRVSGYSICNKLKKDPELGRIPLVLTSSQATEETFEQHRKLKTRAEAYLKKPYGDAEILALLSPYLGKGGAAAADDVELGLDEVSVDIDVGGLGGSGIDAEVDELQPTPSAAVRAKAPALSEAAVSPRASPRVASSSLGGAGASAAARSAPNAAALAASDGQLEQLRSENRQLRQKVQKLEESIEQKELEFNDRLLAESSRGREGLEAKKKAAALERDVNKYKEAAERASAELEESRRELDDTRVAGKSADSEKQVLATKIGQLVDKVKSLAAERDALRGEVERLTQAQAEAQEETENAAKVREKARKAVDIALQLLDETGLTQ